MVIPSYIKLLYMEVEAGWGGVLGIAVNVRWDCHGLCLLTLGFNLQDVWSRASNNIGNHIDFCRSSCTGTATVLLQEAT